jgi:LmbE family N-acetylglucosaminyl deacetylase
MAKVAMAIGAHPDDVEFMMAGTLVLLKEAGYEIHYMNLADGCCGSATLSRRAAARVRAKEARRAAALVGATFHPSLVPDIEILYDRPTLARLGAVLRRVAPEILLVPAPDDYMEDHTNTSRLAVTAAFCMGMRNFPTRPRTRPVAGDRAVYHAMPYGLRDGLRRRVRAGLYVDVGAVRDVKRRMLACHRSQKEWLDRSQGVDSYLDTMEATDREVGRLSGRFTWAEGWRRHLHLGFSGAERDPLAEALGRRALVDKAYERRLEGRA